jgi:general secretion pathway protein D
MRVSVRVHFWRLLILVFLVASQGRVWAAEEEGSVEESASEVRQGYVTMNFKDVDLQVLIKFISELTGKNFLVDPDVKGKVTILSPGKVTVDEAYKVFQSILEVHDYTVVPAGKVIKIVPAIKARSKGVETIPERMPRSPEDKIVTQLLPLAYADVDLLSKSLRPLIEKTGVLIPYPDTNTLIVIDVMSNVSRLTHIIGELDVPGDEKIQVLELKYAKAEDLAKKLQDVFQEEKGRRRGKQSLKIIADERTNSLIARADSVNIAHIELLIGKLDQKTIRPRENIHIYSLENAVAEDLAKVLSEIPGKGAEGEKGKAPLISKDVQITGDKATNTLVIIAEPDEYLILEDVIKELDAPRTMVYVEAAIMEVLATKALDLGVEWRFGNEYDGGYGEGKSGGFWFGGSRGPGAIADNLAQEGEIPSGFVAGVIGRGITLGSITFPSISAFVRAVRTDTDFNIISTPQILTLDNEEATIEVGQNLPFVTRVDQGTAVTDRAIQSFEYKDVGLSLKVTPQINNSRVVRLQVEQSLKSVIETTATSGDETVLAPTTTFRTTKTTITVKDGETAVISGLMEERMEKGRTQVPCLGNVPFFGWLFKTTSDRDEKTNLMVFLAPHIIENAQEGRALYEEKKEHMDRKMEEAIERVKKQKLRKKAFD